MIRFRLELTRSDYDEMNRVAQSLPGHTAWLRPLNRAAYAAAGVGFVLIVARPPVPNWLAPMLLIALALVSLIYPTWYAYREADRDWERQASEAEGVSVELGPKGL